MGSKQYQSPPFSINGYYKASVLRRLAAYIIDMLLLSPFYLISYLVFSFSLGPKISILFDLTIGAIYHIFFTWKYGATLGKKWVSIKIVDLKYAKITFAQALVRETIGKFFSSLFFNLGFLWALWDKETQTWHDKLAETYVVTRNPSQKTSVLTFIIVFTFVVIPVIAILVATVVIIINPIELARKNRDNTRLSDLTRLNQTITFITEKNRDHARLCYGQPRCLGSTDIFYPNIKNIDGTGWIKIDLRESGFLYEDKPELPIDPINTIPYYYKYCSDGLNWELNTRLESRIKQELSQQDGGDDPSIYEVGTNLNLCR